MSKPMGPLPAEFADQAGVLRIGGHSLTALIAEAGDTPFFVYDAGIIRSRIARFRAAFGASVQLHYAVKANPYPPLLRWIGEKVDGLDVASAGEMRSAIEAGADPLHVSFAGPGKRDREIEEAISAGVTINLESEGEAERALRIGTRLGRRPRLAVRVNPDFEIKGSGMRMSGGAKPFGLDAARVPALVRRLLAAGADWRGFHIFAGSQALSAEALIEAQAATLALAADLAEAAGAPPPLVNLGGGFGIPYVAGDSPLAVEAVAARLREGLSNRPQVLEKSQFSMELGRWLVGEAGVYLTRIVDRKESHGKTFLVVDGGLHHQLAASGNFGQVVRRNYPVRIAERMNAAGEEEVSIVGCLCTPLDRLADDVLLPRADVGDVVAVFLAGAYGASASPSTFLGHGPAEEMLVNAG